MGANGLTSASDYLRSRYEGPEPDFVDGEVISRATPNAFHSRAVLALIAAFLDQARGTLFPLPELRIRVGGERYRVVDLAIFDHMPKRAVPDLPPLVAIEVLSPDDSHADLMAKFADYTSAGIPHVWLVDPITHALSIYQQGSLIAVENLELTGVPVSIPRHSVLPS